MAVATAPAPTQTGASMRARDRQAPRQAQARQMSPTGQRSRPWADEYDATTRERNGTDEPAELRPIRRSVEKQEQHESSGRRG